MDYRSRTEVEKRIIPILKRIEMNGVVGTVEDTKAICEAIMIAAKADYTTYEQGCGR